MKFASLWQKAIVVTLLALMLFLAVPAKEASACSGCGCPTYYKVRYGNTLYSIARWYGVTVGQLQSWNHIANPNRIYAGQWLVIYPDCGGGHGFWYVVRWGDTLWSIAARYGTTVWAIAHANGISNVNYIWAGQHLWIP
ncbi:MAG TPA: LysM peptidoglycan-binding domain-containing protein [Anaerolineae bacterium]|nr:LysM peptidoglycan-binding domain-containing protein [Anaerolineae bacterium]